MSRSKNPRPVIRLLVVGVLAGTPMLAAACGGDDEGADGEADDETVVIGVIYPTLAQEFWTQVQTGVREAAASDPGVELVEDSTRDYSQVQEQIAKVESMLSRGVDAILIQPVVAPALGPVLERALNEGVEVVLHGHLVDGLDAPLVTPNQEEGGRLAGEFLASRLNEGDQVGVLTCGGGLVPIDQRVTGFSEALAPSGATIVAILDGECDRAKGVEASQDLFTAHPDVKAIFGANDQMVLGAVEAARAAGREPGQDLILVGFDAVDEAIANVETGVFAATVNQFPNEFGAVGLQTAVSAARGEELPAVIDSGVGLVTADNVDG